MDMHFQTKKYLENYFMTTSLRYFLVNFVEKMDPLHSGSFLFFSTIKSYLASERFFSARVGSSF